ncbi:MAG TPA: fasciclin domain-containing protein [Fimbriimonadaceae bacterium]|nr:fasciclin domain-containing protein [Fimbriimonadaceae bacterium]
MANLLESARVAGRFTQFLELAKQTGMDVALQSTGPLTLFAPNDEAMAKLSARTIETISGNSKTLMDLVKYHVLDGRYTSVDLEGLSTSTTLQGEDVEIRVDEGVLKIDGAHVVRADITADNGVIHSIDTVLVPESAALTMQSQ